MILRIPGCGVVAECCEVFLDVGVASLLVGAGLIGDDPIGHHLDGTGAVDAHAGKQLTLN